MPLDESCEIYLERLLVVKPTGYDWGWCIVDPSDIGPSYGGDEGPEPFKFRVQDFVFVADKMIGAVGVIEQPGHIFNRMQVIVEISDRNICTNFTDKISRFDIEIGTGLSIEEGEELEFPNGFPIVYGSGYVGASLKSIDANIRRSVKRIKHEKAEQ